MLLGVSLCALQDCCTANTISVTGNGKTTGIPDIATFTVGITVLKSNSKDAAAGAAAKTTQILAVRARGGVNKADIQTSQLFINPSYDYPNGTQVFKGQEATQTVSVKVRNIGDGSAIGKIVDDLTPINGIQISGINFDIEKKAPLLREARKNAFVDANTKATELALLSGKSLGSVLTINEGQNSNYIPFRSGVMFAAAKVSDASTTVSIGQLDITVDVSIVWKIR